MNGQQTGWRSPRRFSVTVQHLARPPTPWTWAIHEDDATEPSPPLRPLLPVGGGSQGGRPRHAHPDDQPDARDALGREPKRSRRQRSHSKLRHRASARAPSTRPSSFPCTNFPPSPTAWPRRWRRGRWPGWTTSGRCCPTSPPGDGPRSRRTPALPPETAGGRPSRPPGSELGRTVGVQGRCSAGRSVSERQCSVRSMPPSAPGPIWKLPPICRASARTIRRPRPVPCGGAAGSTPMPSSLTLSVHSPSRHSKAMRTVPLRPPGKAYLRALTASSLTISPSGLACATGGRCGAACTSAALARLVTGARLLARAAREAGVR